MEQITLAQLNLNTLDSCALESVRTDLSLVNPPQEGERGWEDTCGSLTERVEFILEEEFYEELLAYYMPEHTWEEGDFAVLWMHKNIDLLNDDRLTEHEFVRCMQAGLARWYSNQQNVDYLAEREREHKHLLGLKRSIGLA